MTKPVVETATMHPVLQAILIGLPASVLGFLIWWQSRKVDAVAEQSGITTETRAGTAQIFDGLNKMISNLQIDNQVFRDELKYLTLRLDMVAKERDELKKEVSRLRRKYETEEEEIEAEVEVDDEQKVGRHRKESS